MAEHAELLDLSGRRLDVVLVIFDGCADRRVDRISAGVAARCGGYVDVGRGDLLSRSLLDADRHKLSRNAAKDARARHDVHAHAVVLLGSVCDGAVADDRNDRTGGGAGGALYGAPVRRAVLRPDEGRQPGAVAAYVLVLLAPGRLHHGSAGVRDYLGSF